MSVNTWQAVNSWGVATGGASLSGNISMPSMLAAGVFNVEQPGTVTINGNVAMPSMLTIGSISATSPDPELAGNISMPAMTVSGFIQGPIVRLKPRKVIRVY